MLHHHQLGRAIVVHIKILLDCFLEVLFLFVGLFWNLGLSYLLCSELIMYCLKEVTKTASVTWAALSYEYYIG
jgi:hypothetical protein